MRKRKDQYDVLVVGGGSAGIAAAVGASRSGAKTIIIEKNPYFGGALTNSSVLTICGMYSRKDPMERVVGGVGNEILDMVKAMGMSRGPYRSNTTKNIGVIVDPEAAKFAFDEIIRTSNVTPLLHTKVTKVEKSGDNIQSVECLDHNGPFTVEAKTFIDASGEADLTALAGGDVQVGNADGELQIGTLVMRIGGVPETVDLNPELVHQAIMKAKDEGVQLTKEKGPMIRLPYSHDILAIFADVAVNGLDSSSLTEAELVTREQAWRYIETFKKYIPGFESAYLVQTGPSLGIRETRHVLGEYTLTAEDVIEGRKHSDVVALGGWPIEIHAGPGKPPIYKSIRDDAHYEIPLRSLKEKSISNLWCAGRIISCDPTAFASARVMGTGFATGHAAGVAAAYYTLHGNQNVHAIQQELIRQEAII
ncbi:FAD-dependent oxidoreductase [Sporosarcina sp. 179-K 3D1 HS]|uniref:FAD-dependent oxidoreductase n=1 Tax=Sporosarcina sp. 179-K 3D1 HS TaxID=3232169 RepID=UPI0039A10ACA